MAKCFIAISARTPVHRVAIPKVLSSNFGYSDPVDRGVPFLQFFLSFTAFPVYFTQCVPWINPSF